MSSDKLSSHSTSPEPPPSAPAATPAQPPTAAPPASAASQPRHLSRRTQIFAIAGVVVVVSFFGLRWIMYRSSHSITEDAFVEAHIVNVAPEAVSGRIVRFLVDENDHVDEGQVVAEIDPILYRDKVELARSKVEGTEAELLRQEADLARVRDQVPIQIEISKRTLEAAQADEIKAKAALELTTRQVETGIVEAQAGLDLSQPDVVFSQEEYQRFTTLYKDDAVPQRRSQEVTRARDAARSQRNLAAAKLARAEATKTEIDVARRTLEAAEKTKEKAQDGVDLALTGNDQIKETELLTAVKREMVQEARRGLIAAEDELKYCRIRAPFPGVVVKRYRHLGDFVSAGTPILSMYNPDLLYVTANLEETRLRRVAPGNHVTLYMDAFAAPFRGRVTWINKSTGAQFALMPRNVVSGEFTKVVQRVPVRIWIDKDDRWPQLQAGLSVRAEISHGAGDPTWAEQAAREMAEREMRYNKPQPPEREVSAPHRP
jgi:membrane fusion protein (multidrug efflux system)